MRPLYPFLVIWPPPDDAEIVYWGGRKFVRLPEGGWAIVEGNA